MISNTHTQKTPKKQGEQQNSLCDQSKSKTEQINKEETGRKLRESARL